MCRVESEWCWQVVMLVSTAACGYWSGAVPLLFGHCRSASSVSAFSMFRPWAALEYAAIFGKSFPLHCIGNLRVSTRIFQPGQVQLAIL